MIDWWNGLGPLNQWFYGAAFFFSVIFLWQFISSIVGMGGDVDVATDADVDVDGLDMDQLEAHSLEEAGDTMVAFKVLSLRAILAFCTLFTWAGALYLNNGTGVTRSLLYATLWGLSGWVVVALLVNWIRRLGESGTQRLATCVGTSGAVYLDIPAGGQGEVRVAVSGVMTHVKARAAGDAAIKAGTPVRVRCLLDAGTIEVEPTARSPGDAR